MKVIYASRLLSDETLHAFKFPSFHFLALTSPFLYTCCRIIDSLSIPKASDNLMSLEVQSKCSESSSVSCSLSNLLSLEYVAANLKVAFCAMLVNKMRNLQLFTLHLWKYCNKKTYLG